MTNLLHGGLLSAICLLAAQPALAQEAAPSALSTTSALAIDEDAAPALPTGFNAGFVVPARDAAGYLTPNRDLTAGEVTWHVRVALNVAALGCRDAAEAQTVAAYNALLASEKATLAAADAATQTQEKARFGAHWQDVHDGAQTRLYNFFAQPPAQREFCRVAEAVLGEAQGIEPADFPAFAAAALPRLEAPFLAAYATWDSYRAAAAAWQARHAPVATVPAVVIATAATAPLGPVAK